MEKNENNKRCEYWMIVSVIDSTNNTSNHCMRYRWHSNEIINLKLNFVPYQRMLCRTLQEDGRVKVNKKKTYGHDHIVICVMNELNFERRRTNMTHEYWIDNDEI